MATMSILGLYSYDPTIFDGMVLPDEMDKNILVNNILMNFAELEVLYPDPNFMKNAIAQWCGMRLQSWERMQTVLYAEYDPFINIKRDEERTITETRDLAGSGESTGKVSAWNETDFQNRNRNLTETTDTGTVTTHETFHVEGDSAITDAQDVLKKEMDVRLKFNLYQIIMEEFKQRFLLMIY